MRANTLVSPAAGAGAATAAQADKSSVEAVNNMLIFYLEEDRVQ